MSSYSKIYWLTRLDALHTFFGVMALLGLIAVCVILITSGINKACEEEYDKAEYYKKAMPKIKWVAPVAILSFLIYGLIPTRTEALLIVAGGKTMDYVQSDTSLRKIPYQTTTIISEFLDKQLQELKKEK